MQLDLNWRFHNGLFVACNCMHLHALNDGSVGAGESVAAEDVNNFAGTFVNAPLQLIGNQIPPSIQGKFDHLGTDLKGDRLFAAAETWHAVLVFELRTGTFLHALNNIPIPHAIFVRSDLNRTYITDGGEGVLRI